MFLKKSAALAAFVTFGMAAGSVVAPHAVGETLTKQIDLPLACNLQLKEPGWLTSGAQGVYNSANPKFSAFKLSASATLPRSVAAGESFEYTIDFGTVSLPAEIPAAVTAKVSKVSQLNLWIELPENATLESFEAKGGNPAVKVEQVGNQLHFTGEGGADVTQWSTANRKIFAHGGLSPAQEGGKFVLDVPAVTLKLKAPEAEGATVRPFINPSDAKAFSPQAFVQFYSDASAFGTTVNGFVRCGLSEFDSYYPSTGKTNIVADSFPAVEVEAKQEPTEPAPTGPTPAEPETEAETQPTEPEPSFSSKLAGGPLATLLVGALVAVLNALLGIGAIRPFIEAAIKQLQELLGR